MPAQLDNRRNAADRRRIGVLGGGQLARMLAEAAARLGLTPVIFTSAADDPASQIAPETVVGSTMDEAALASFFRSVPTVIFENEFVDVPLLARASEGAGVHFVPGLPTIARLQDKLEQKHILAAARVAHPETIEPEPDENRRAFIARVLGRWPAGAVLKWSRLGYDGHGVFFLGADSPQDVVENFIERGEAAGGVVYAEERIDFTRELAMIATASHDQHELVTYPLVISRQERGICRLVTGPAVLLGVPPELERAAAEACARVADAAKVVGTFAIEFFETRDGRLLVNEIAPRVHNTGHYTLDAAATSQFENHVRAATGLPLGEPRCAPAFGMLNLLGPEGVSMAASNIDLPQPLPGSHLHWYGKQQLRPRRKLAHLNCSATSPAELADLVAEMQNVEARWIESVRAALKENDRE